MLDKFSPKNNLQILLSKILVKQMITLKMADQEKSDFCVVFTMILCGLSLSYEADIHGLAPNGFSSIYLQFETFCELR